MPRSCNLDLSAVCAQLVRELRGTMTQHQLAERSKVSRGVISAIEAHRNSNINLLTIVRLAPAFGLTAAEFVQIIEHRLHFTRPRRRYTIELQERARQLIGEDTNNFRQWKSLALSCISELQKERGEITHANGQSKPIADVQIVTFLREQLGGAHGSVEDGT